MTRAMKACASLSMRVRGRAIFAAATTLRSRPAAIGRMGLVTHSYSPRPASSQRRETLASRLCAAVLALAAFTAPLLAQDCASTATSSAIKIEYEAAGSAVGIPSALLFKGSSDGTLRAEDVATGSELWSYRPPEATAAITAGERMTHLSVLRFDSNNDGVINPRDGDRVWLYFGLKRAGAIYYAIDVTNKTPRVLWRADSTTMPGLGEAWSTPTITRVRLSGPRQNGEHLVVILGGGLNSRGLFMLDAASGRVLWSAGDTTPASMISTQMTEGFASRIVAIDFDGDQFADRLYAADVGARIWRFDIWNGRAPADLVTGGVFASLGNIAPFAPPPAPAPTAADARRFFTAPDVAYIRPRGEAPFYNISIGSGDAENLSATPVQDRFYALRDHAPFKRLTQAEYDATAPIFDTDLPGAKGWKLDLKAGERALTESLTVNGVTLFTAFSPNNGTELCEATGTNRIYAVKVENAAPALDLNDDAQITDADISAALEEKGIAAPPRVEIVKPGGNDAPPSGPGSPTEPPSPADPSSPQTAVTTRCLIGTEALNQCVQLGTVVRTFWKRTTVN